MGGMIGSILSSSPQMGGSLANPSSSKRRDHRVAVQRRFPPATRPVQVAIHQVLREREEPQHHVVG